MATRTVLYRTTEGDITEEIEILDDELAQKKLTAAEAILWAQLEGQDLDDNPRMWVAFSVIRSLRIYAKSGNSIPGYSGQGLQEAIALADSIVANPPKSDRDITIHSYKHMATGITVGEPR